MPMTIPKGFAGNVNAAKKWARDLREGSTRIPSGKTVATAITLGLVREVVTTETIPGYTPGTTREITRRHYEAT